MPAFFDEQHGFSLPQAFLFLDFFILPFFNKKKSMKLTSLYPITKHFIRNSSIELLLNLNEQNSTLLAYYRVF